jgi:hypothetical protein
MILPIVYHDIFPPHSVVWGMLMSNILWLNRILHIRSLNPEWYSSPILFGSLVVEVVQKVNSLLRK